MRVNTEEKQDRYGRYPACRVSGKDANPQNVHEYLYRHNGSGYKYAIVINCMPEEYEEMPKETEIYFLDDILEEVMVYVDRDKVLDKIGEDRVRKWLEKRNGNS